MGMYVRLNKGRNKDFTDFKYWDITGVELILILPHVSALTIKQKKFKFLNSEGFRRRRRKEKKQLDPLPLLQWRLV